MRMKKLLKSLSVFGLLAAPLLAQTLPLLPAAAVSSPAAQSFHEKFMRYAISAYGPRAVAAPAFSAALVMIDNPSGYPRAWRDGPGAFERNYGNGLGRRTSKETGRFLAGTLLHEDFRYRPSTSGNPLVRGFHALAFTFIDKSDSGNNRFAVANFAGAEAGGFVGDFWLPPGFNNLSHAETRAAISFGSFAAQNLYHEFEPDLRRLSRRLGLPRIPVSDWWVKRN
jgi:hypothetical protein